LRTNTIEMPQMLKAKVSTGPYDPVCPRSHKIRKNGPPLRMALSKMDVKRNLRKEFDQEATHEAEEQLSTVKKNHSVALG
jgi:hypothetical protein